MALAGCVSRNLQEEKKRKQTKPQDDSQSPDDCDNPLMDCEEPDEDDPNNGLIHGYCEYEGRVSCWTDDDGIDWCYEYWIRLYCVVF